MKADMSSFFSTIGELIGSSKKPVLAGCRWLTPVILATQKAEIRQTVVLSQPLSQPGK
jgi:hypothetical protein